MKRAHRSLHRLIWLIMPLLLAAIIAVSLIVRPAEPVQDSLPEVLLEEAL